MLYVSVPHPFQIHCNGTRHYMSVDGLESLDVAEKIQYAPAGKFQIFIGDLQANFNYSCNIWEDVDYGTQVFRGEVSETFKFSTDYGGNINKLFYHARD